VRRFEQTMSPPLGLDTGAVARVAGLSINSAMA